MALSETTGELLGQLQNVLTKGQDVDNDPTVRREALRLSRLLVTSLENPVEVAYETNLLPAFTACCRIAVQLGIFRILAENNGPCTASELAKRTGAEHLLIVRTVRILCAMRIIKETGKEEYEALPVTRVMASRTMETAQIHHWDQGVSCLAKLPQYLKEKGFRSPHDPRNGLLQFSLGTDLEAFEYWHQNPEVLENFNTLMQGIRASRPSWVEWFPIQERIIADADVTTPDSVLLIDIAGGRGHDIEQLQSKFPQPEGKLVLEDLPAVIDDIKRLDPAIKRIKANFFQPQPVRGARAYYFSHIFHDWSDDPCRSILKNLKPAFKPGYSKLLLNEFILPDVGCSFLQAGFDIGMMAMHAGAERTETQWTELLASEGFKVVKFWLPPGADGEGIIEAELS